VYPRNSIVSGPLLIGIVVSVALHGAALYSKNIYTPPKPKMEQGRTVVQLTLLPSIASKGNPEPEIQISKPIQHESVPEPTPLPKQPPTPNPKPQTTTPSPEQDASLIEEKGVTAEAQTFKAVNPVYPRISRRRSEEGTVILSINVLANGTIDGVSMVESSGYHRLDDAALKAAQQTTFTPAKQLGRNIDSTTELSFTFRLTDD